MHVDFVTQECAAYARACDHVRTVYRDAYGAEVRQFAPVLATATHRNGALLCVAGLRTAATGFFSDSYLDRPLDQRLSGLGQGQVSADQVLEVVSLATTSHFAVLPLLDAITVWGRAHALTWGVFTATAPLRRLLRRAGMPFADLAAARPECLPDPQSWGSYYETDPRVCALNDSWAGMGRLNPRHGKGVVGIVTKAVAPPPAEIRDALGSCGMQPPLAQARAC